MGIYSNAALLEAAKINTNESCDPIQFAIDTRRADLAMFESLIQVDFLEAYNESGIICLTEEEKEAANDTAKKGIIEKIKNAIKKIIQWIKDTINKITSKITELFNKDKKIYEKYKDYVLSSKIENCDIKAAGFKVVDSDNYNNLINLNVFDLMEDGFEGSDGVNIFGLDLKRYSKEEVIEKIDEIVDKFKKSCEAIRNHAQEMLSDDKFYVKTSDNDLLVKAIGNSGHEHIQRSIKTGLKDSMKYVKACSDLEIKRIKMVESTVNKAKSTPGNDAHYILNHYNAGYACINELSRLINNETEIKIQAIKKNYGESRKIFIALGNWSMQNQNSTKSNEEDSVDESYCWEMGELSDIYVEEAFAL